MAVWLLFTLYKPSAKKMRLPKLRPCKASPAHEAPYAPNWWEEEGGGVMGGALRVDSLHLDASKLNPLQPHLLLLLLLCGRRGG